jgi:DNA-binding response OmpR family regulator
MNLKMAEADLVAFTRGVVQLSAPLAAREGVAIAFQPGEPYRLAFFDADKLEKILLELISNALKFTPAKGRVAVATRFDATSARITVEDSGVGISGESLPVIFDSARAPSSPGLIYLEEPGLGLVLAREWVQLHGGTITVQSPVHPRGTFPGARFEIILPLARPTGSTEPSLCELSGSSASLARPFEGSIPPPSSLSLTNSGSQPLIFVAEDNADLAAYLRQRLCSQYRVIAADIAEIALARILETVPDLVLAESVLPGLDGIELCQRIRCHERTSHIPVILLSARDLEADHARALEVGADDYFPKPFSTALLLARIHNLLESRRRLIERFRQQINLQTRDVAITSPDAQFLRRVRETVEQHLSDSRFNADDLARNLALSRRQLFRKFKGLTGLTPHTFLRSMRMERAAQLLKGSQMTIMQITFAVGFDDLKHFRTVFRQQFGLLPSEFAKTKS